MQEDQDILQLHPGEESGASLIRAVGDIDLSTTPQLRQAVESLIAGLPNDGELRFLMLDIREVPFIDSAGLALLVEIRKRFHGTCRLAVLIAAATQPERVLRLGRFDTFLMIGYSVEELQSLGVGQILTPA